MRFLIKTLGFVFLLVTFLAGPARPQADPEFAPIEIRLVAQKAGDGPKLAAEGSARMLEVESETLLGPSDFVGVGQVERVEGKPGFNVTLTRAGARKYERISGANVGRTLAIIVGGKILMTPKILDPVRAQGFLLTVNTEAEAGKLAEKVRQAVSRSTTGD